MSPFISRLSLYATVFIFVLQSCVPHRQFEDVKAARDTCEAQMKTYRAEYESFKAKEKEMGSRLSEQDKQISMLTRDTTSMGITYRRLTTSYDKLNQTYDQLLANNAALMKGKEDDNRELMGKFQMTQEELQKKEDRLRESEQALEKREAEVNKLSQELTAFEQELNSKEARVQELEGILARKDSTVSALFSKVENALLGFKDNGLSMSVKNGKVYVSLEERLLFASGSTDVDAKGVDALKKLSKVLENEKDINVLIEGHTDNVPIKSARMKDNWDLSVLRATSIVRILIGNSDVDPRIFTVAGRGEYFPIDPANTAEARKKNRRTEIILTPNLDELFKILETN
ncbi:MAG: OmpA family protein [Bacteroidetes bacterium]|nr:OmpA family protein [Bacteroidota bacterium]